MLLTVWYGEGRGTKTLRGIKSPSPISLKKEVFDESMAYSQNLPVNTVSNRYRLKESTGSVGRLPGLTEEVNICLSSENQAAASAGNVFLGDKQRPLACGINTIECLCFRF